MNPTHPTLFHNPTRHLLIPCVTDWQEPSTLLRNSYFLSMLLSQAHQTHSHWIFYQFFFSDPPSIMYDPYIFHLHSSRVEYIPQMLDPRLLSM